MEGIWIKLFISARLSLTLNSPVRRESLIASEQSELDCTESAAENGQDWELKRLSEETLGLCSDTDV